MDKDEEVRHEVMREIDKEMEPYKKPVPLSYRTFYVTTEHPRVPIQQGIRMLSIPCMGKQGLRNTHEWLRKFHPEWKIICPKDCRLEQILQEETPEELMMMQIQILEDQEIQAAATTSTKSLFVNLDTFNNPVMKGKKMSFRMPGKEWMFLVEITREEKSERTV